MEAVADARIMVVEDEGIVALDIQSKLEGMGYEVLAVVSRGEDAITRAEKQDLDLVLMDIQLEGEMDGVEAATHISVDLDIPVVYLTAYSDDSTLERAKVARPMGYLLKPFEERELYTTVEIALYKHQVEKERGRLEERLRQSQKMEAIGQLTANLAHNFNNMLQGIIGNLDLVSMTADSEIRLHLDDAMYDAQRAARLVEQLMFFYRRERTVHERLDVGELLAEVAELCSGIFDRSIRLDVDVGSKLPPVLGNREQLRQCLVNVCANCRDAVSGSNTPNPVIGIRGEMAQAVSGESSPPPDATAQNFIQINISDNGPGMDDATRERMFEPFFTTKTTGMPTGLGLSISYGVARDHGGWIDSSSQPGAGTTVSVFLPVAGDDVEIEEEEFEWEAGGDPAGTIEELRGAESILVIADVDRFRKILDLMLERQGYRVLLGRDGRDGLQLFSHERDNIDLVVLGLSLPGMSTRHVLSELMSINPKARILVVIGHPMPRSGLPGATATLLKPFDTAQLLHAVRGILDSH